MGFTKLKLDNKIIKALEDAGYTVPTKIQEESIPPILDGLDIRASAQTGTGKTAAFLLPALHLLADEEKPKTKGAKILILTPTRELAQQITTQAEKYSKYMNKVKSVCVVGGVPYHKQQSKLSSPHDIIIATPGRLMDYMNRGKINLSNLEMVILDEADRMLDMGFSESVEEILRETPKNRQTLLFSATLDGEVLQLSNKFMKSPVEIKVHSSKQKHEGIDQKLLYIDNLSHKNELLDYILNAEDLTSAIVFTATKRHCDELVDELEEKNFAAGALHGDMNQRQRTQTINSLKLGRINILVATDVAARGLDISDISHVINFDLPRDVEDYVHRIGRTGRAGKTGVAISFAGSKDMHMVPRIEKFTGQAIKIIEIQGLEPKTKPKASKEDPPRSRRSKPRNSSARSEERSFGDRREGRGSFGERSESRDSRPRRDSRDSEPKRDSKKSFGERSDFKDSADKRKTSKSSNRSDFDRPREDRSEERSAPRRSFDRPQRSEDRKEGRSNERRSFDRPREDRSEGRSSQRRSFDRPERSEDRNERGSSFAPRGSNRRAPSGEKRSFGNKDSKAPRSGRSNDSPRGGERKSFSSKTSGSARVKRDSR